LLGLILQHFIEHGTAPDETALQVMAGGAGVELPKALASLVGHDLLILEAENRRVLSAYPFSAVPTAYRVTIAGRATVFAMCAVDALGIAFLAGRSTTIDTCDASSGEGLRIAVDVPTGSVTTDHPEVVVYAPSTAHEGAAATAICPVIAFFRSAAAAEAYGRADPHDAGHILSLDDAVSASRSIFEDPGDFFPAG
jgi:hypothetical protein